jgi:hypothetical protein
MEKPDRQFRELFQQLKAEDERRAPAFARVMAGANEATHISRRLAWRLAIAALALLVGVSLWFAFFRPGPESLIVQPVTPPPAAPRTAPAPLRESPPPQLAVVARPPIRRAKQQLRKTVPPLEALVTQWHSPTEFLLRTPSDALLKTVPRLGETYFENKALVPEPEKHWEEE